MATFGYAGKILRADLSSGSITEVPTQDYAERFLGGRGIAAKIYWDEVPPEAGAFDAENRLVFVTGPLAGLPALGGSRWQVCGKSAETDPEHFCYGNLGGRWGADLKFAGYDAIVVHGKSEKPAYLFLHDDVAEVKDASALWGRGAIETRESLKRELGRSVSVVAIGPAGENMATMAILLADNDACGTGGLAAVMGSKKLKAIVVGGAKKGVKVAQPERLRELTRYFREVGEGWGNVWVPQAEFLIPVMTSPRAKAQLCYGCLGRCSRRTYEAEDGKKGKFMCAPCWFYMRPAHQYYGGWNDVPFYAAKLCDDYGVDAIAIDLIMWWLDRCYKAGILTDENTGIPISKFGSLEFMETLVRKIALRDGIGDILAQGILKGAALLGPEARAQIDNHLPSKDAHGPGEGDYYGARLYVTTALIHATEPRPPIHTFHELALPLFKWLNWYEKTMEGAYVSTDVLRAIAKRFWGSELAADFSTYEGKALAAKKLQDREYAEECLILCDFLWPVLFIEGRPEDHVGDPALESKVLSAVTGDEVDEEGLYRIGERVFNLQRAILVREGQQGRADDKLIPDYWHTRPLEGDLGNIECLLPGKEGEVISRKGAVVDRKEFEKMKDEYYQLRGWDVATGLQTRAALEELGLGDVTQQLERRGLIA